MAESNDEIMARLFRALEAADAAGNEEDAQALADEIRRRRQLSAEPPGAMTRFSSGAIQGIAKTAGAPVDLVNSLLKLFGAGSEEPLGGSRNIQRGFEAIGLTGPVDKPIELGRAGQVGDIVGQAAAAGPAVVAGGVRSLATAGSRRLAGQTPGAGRRVIEEVAQTAIKRPGRFTAAETAAATGAGLAGFEAANRFPDSPGARAMGEIVGGFTPAVAGTVVRKGGQVVLRLPLLVPIVGRAARNVVSSRTFRGAKSRAKGRIKRAIEDPEVARERLARTDVLPEAPLSVAQRIGDERLLALERSVMESTPELSVARQKQFAAVNQAIRNSLEAPIRETPTHQVKEYFTGLLETRLQQAAVRADERLAALGGLATREDLNRIAREELLAARSAAREQERQLHQAIPESAQAPITASETALRDFQIGLPAAQRADIPEIANRFLNPKSKQYIADTTMDGEPVTKISELRGLQGKLREEARIARADKRLNRARIADELADAITEDIANAVGGPEVRESVDIAVAFSRDLNDRFTRGEVGKLLGTDRRGSAAVPEGMTLEVTVGARGPRAREATDALLEAVRRSGDEEALRGHIQDFLIDDFRRAAVRDGRVDVRAAERYLRENQDVLARFPELRRELDRARTSGDMLIEAERLADPKVSRAAVFIQAVPGTEIERVIATSRPREAMEELAALARQDPTGKAEEGLKAAFMDFLLRKSELTGSLDVNDLPFVSGARLSRELDDPEVLDAMQGLFSRGELERIAKIKQTALLVDRARASPEAEEGVLGDLPGTLTSIMARVGGAQIGRMIAGRTGGGTVQTPGILSSHVQKLLRAGVQDPGKRLLTDAIQDEDLFKTLLLPVDTLERQRAVRTRLNAWVIDVLREQHEMDEEDEE